MRGVTDAAGFIGLGGAFSSVMTGNMMLLGLAGGAGNASLAAGALIAELAVFCVYAVAPARGRTG